MTCTPFNRYSLPACGLLAAAVCLLASPPVATALTTTDFSRYEVILQRRPFGEAPPDTSPPVLPTPLVQAGPSFADRIQLCALTRRGDSYSVGIVDNAQKPSCTYFMRVGESKDGIEVLDVDYAAERVLLRNSTEERWVDMNVVSMAPFFTALFICKASTGCATVVLVPMANMHLQSAISPIELVMAPLPNEVTRPATVGECHNRAQ